MVEPKGSKPSPSDESKDGQPKPGQERSMEPGVQPPAGKKMVEPKGSKPSPSDESKDGQPKPLPRSQILPVPQVSIDGVEPLSDGKAQDIEFSLNLPNGVRLERLELDGKQVTVPANGHFKLRLPTGPHVVHIEYGSTSSDLLGEVTQELLVDADQVRVIKPKTRIAPPVKVPGADAPTPIKPRDEAAEKFDKKTA